MVLGPDFLNLEVLAGERKIDKIVYTYYSTHCQLIFICPTLRYVFLSAYDLLS